MTRAKLLLLAAALAASGLVFNGAAQAHGLNHTPSFPPIPVLPSAADRILVSPGHVSVPN